MYKHNDLLHKNNGKEVRRRKGGSCNILYKYKYKNMDIIYNRFLPINSPYSYLRKNLLSALCVMHDVAYDVILHPGMCCISNGHIYKPVDAAGFSSSFGSAVAAGPVDPVGAFSFVIL